MIVWQPPGDWTAPSLADAVEDVAAAAPMKDEEMVNLARLTTRLEGGANVRTVDQIHEALGLSGGGSIRIKKTRIEHALAARGFEDCVFQPTVAEMQLSPAEFNELYAQVPPEGAEWKAGTPARKRSRTYACGDILAILSELGLARDAVL